MSRLEKATLQELDSAGATQGNAIPVQFNPASLRLQMNNSIEGGRTRARQSRQYLGNSSTTLSLELIFDTADEGTTRSPRNVRDKTQMIERFVLPRGQGNQKQAPPRVRFHWGQLIMDGVIESVSIDLDHFASDGTPLRAKVSVSIKEQDSRFQERQLGAGANQRAARSSSGRPGTNANMRPTGGGDGAAGGGITASLSASLSASADFSLGLSGYAGLSLSASAGVSASLSAGVEASATVQALAGESLPEMAARMGLDPGAWRALAPPGGEALSLPAGTEISVPTAVSAGAGLGATTAVQAGARATPERATGLVTDPAGGAETELAAGYALAAAGGVSAAVAKTQAARTSEAASQERAAFQPAGASSTTSAEKPRSDARAASFGYGVPLRPARSTATEERAAVIGGSVRLKPEADTSGLPPVTTDPATPPRLALPAGGRRPSAPQTAGKGSCCNGGEA